MPPTRTNDSVMNNSERSIEGVAVVGVAGQFPFRNNDPLGDHFGAGVMPEGAPIGSPHHDFFLECARQVLEEAGHVGEREEELAGVFTAAAFAGESFRTASGTDSLSLLVSSKLNLRGPSLGIQSGAASLAAAIVACQHLLAYQCDLALTGGISFSSRNETAIESAGVLALKRLADAIADRDQIYAVIKGFAINHDGALDTNEAGHDKNCEAECIALAEALAGISPESPFFEQADGGGIENLIAGALTLHRKQHRGEPDQFAGRQPSRVKIGSFGAGGTNACLILEEATGLPPSSPSRPVQLLLLSAQNETALENATADLAAHLAQHPEESPGDVAYTLQTRRQAFACRRTLICRNHREALEALHTLTPDRVASRRLPEAAPSLIFAFPSQPGLRSHAGRELYEQEPAFREQVDLCAGLLQPSLKVDLRAVLCSSEAPPSRDLVQPALFVLEYALAKLWMSWGIKPEAMIGHGPGEYVAACLAGVISVKDALHLMVCRGSLCDQPPFRSLLLAQLAEAEAKMLLDGNIALASVDSPHLCTLSGPADCLHQLENRLSEKGVAGWMLDGCAAMHSAPDESSAKPFLDLVQKLKLRAPRIPYISSLTGDWITPQQATDPKYWHDQLGRPVLFSTGLQTLLRKPGRIFLEIGFSQTLSALLEQQPLSNRNLLALPFRDELTIQPTDSAALLHTLGQLWTMGVSVDWNGFYAHEQRRSVRLPARSLQSAVAGDGIVQSSMGVSPNTSSSNGERKQTATPYIRDQSQEPPQNGVVSEFRESLDAKPEPTRNGAAHPAPRISFDAGKTNSSEFEPADSVRVSASDVVSINMPDVAASSEIIKSLPLTEAQREIWYAVQMADALSCSFNQSDTMHLRGPLDLPRLTRTLRWLVDRHEALRTTFSSESEIQHIHATLPIEVPNIDLSQLPVSYRKEQLDAELAEMVKEPFNLVQGPLFRLRLVRLGPEEHVLILTLHHLICDGGSFGVLLHELGEGYSADAKDEPGSTEIPQSFSEFAAKEQAAMQSPARSAAESFWLEQYSRPVPNLELPTDRPRPMKRSFAGGSASMLLNRALGHELKRFSARQRSTLVTVLLAGYYLLLHRLTGCLEVVVGLPMTNRAGEGGERLVGHCVNFLPLRLSLEGNPSLADYFTRVRALLLDAHEHQNFTLGSLLQKLDLPRDPGRLPLVSVMFNLAWMREAVKLEGLETKIIPNPHCFSRFDLSVSLTECEGELELHCHYSAELFNPETVQRWLKHYETLLANIVANPDQPIGKYSLLTPAERLQLLVEWARLQPGSTLFGGLPRGTGANNTDHRFYVLDAYLEPAPIGVIGELFVSGPKDAFFDPSQYTPSPDPYRSDPAIQLYRTGLRARYSPLGHIEMLSPEASLNQNETNTVANAASAPAQTRTAVGTALSETEKKLAAIWREVIGLQEVGREDNFFDLGGHSVLLIQVITRVRKTFRVELTLRHLFEAPTIDELARIIDEKFSQPARGLPANENRPLATT